MITVRPPDPPRIGGMFAELATSDYSYPQVGATRGDIPAGFNVDRYRSVLGSGDAVFESAKQALRDWVPFDLPWIRVFPQSEPDAGVMVAVVVHVVGLWWTNVNRVIYTVDEPDVFGFAYGTLPAHAEVGEEQFLVRRSGESAEVTYEILAFSNPRHVLARVAYPLSRSTQRRFGAGSIAAMRKATEMHDDP